MGIPIGKLALYVAAGGIDPRKVLPVMLDLGTDNAALQKDPWYLGMTHPRLRGEEYYSAVHEFVKAVRHRWPNALLQFEDFSSDKASPILETYKDSQLCFNDDIQGTGSVTLGAILAAIRTQSEGAKLSDQRIVICGAGSAGVGVATSLAAAMSDREGIPASATGGRFWMLDKDGLLGAARRSSGSSSSGSLSATARAFCRPAGDSLPDGASLAEVVAAVKPTILLGFTGQGQSWKEPVIREMARHCARPIIFPLSNPTQNAECNAEQAYSWTEGRAVFGGGSPFDAVTLASGRTIQPSQINNMFVFPGIGLASLAVRPKRITNSMFQAAAYAVAGMVSSEDLALGRVVPRVRDIRSVSASVAAAAAQTALVEGIVQRMPPAGDLKKHMASLQYNPLYHPLYNDVY
jgi:malate dehydrogenase (oxaloacetate-decarboxylating)(NADP+)